MCNGSDPNSRGTTGLGRMAYTVDGGIAVRGHSGGYPGFTTRIGFSPEHRLCAAVLTNTISPLSGVALDSIFHAAARVNALCGTTPPPPRTVS